MRFFVFLLLLTIIVACSPIEETEQSEVVEVEESVEENEEEVEVVEEPEEPEEMIPQTENEVPIEQQIGDRINSFLLLSYVGDIKPSLTEEGDYLVLQNIARSFPEEVPVISNDNLFQGNYDVYDMSDLQEALLKYHGFTIDFKKYKNGKIDEEEKIIVRSDYVLLLSTTEFSFEGNQVPVIKSLEQMEDGVYSVHFQFHSFLMDEYEEETGEEWDPAYSQFPIEQWPDEYKPYVKEDPANYFGLFFENEHGLALTYLSKKVPEDEEHIDGEENNVEGEEGETGEDVESEQEGSDEIIESK